MTTIVLYAVIWWLVFFVVLPIGYKPQEEVVPGTPASAPARPLLKKKILITSVIAVFMTAAAYWFIGSGLLVL